MEQLPKVLEAAIEELLCENKLVSWSITSNGNSVNVSMRFLGSHATSTPGSACGLGLRKKSPSQVKRDSERYLNRCEPRLDSDLLYTANEYNEQSVELSHIPGGNIANESRLVTGEPVLCKTVTDQTTMADDPVTQERNVNKTKACGQADVQTEIKAKYSDEGSGSENDLSDDSDSLNVIVPADLESPFNPKNYFSKIVADFRGCVPYLTLRARTYENEIVLLETDREEGDHDGFYVLTESSDESGYKENICVMNMFSDQIGGKSWNPEIQELCKRWEQYAKAYT